MEVGRLIDRIKGRNYDSNISPEELQYYQAQQGYVQPEDGYYEEQQPQYVQEPQYVQQQRRYYEEPEEDIEVKETPMTIMKDIKKDPSPKGTYPTVIGGMPVDLHILEDYVIRSSPYALKTILRYHHARDVEEMKGYGRSKMNINGKTIMLIILAVGMALLGIFVIMFLPNILKMFQGGI